MKQTVNPKPKLTRSEVKSKSVYQIEKFYNEEQVNFFLEEIGDRFVDIKFLGCHSEGNESYFVYMVIYKSE